MKFHTKRMRRLRRLAIAGCVIAVVAPSSASAMLPDRGPVRDNAQPQSQPYSLPSGFRTEAQTTAPQSTGVQQFTLHRSFRPEVQTSAPAHASIPAASVVRQIETVNDNSGKTLAIVLASIALAVALGSIAYVSIRLSQLQRRELGSH